MPRAISLVVTTALALTLGALPLQAQQSDADAPALQQKNEKRVEPTPVRLSFVEKVRRYVERNRLVERLSPEEGFYPRIGGLATGGGFAGGGGYRKRVFGDNVLFDVSGAISTKGYRAGDVKVRWLQAWRQRIELWNELKYRDLPQEDYWGLGPDSSPDARSNYAMRTTDFAGRVAVKLRPWLRVGGDVGYLTPSIRSGEDPLYPSVEQRFGESEIPGFTVQPDFIHNTVFAEVDYRDRPGNTRTGGFYRVSYGTWDDHNFDLFDFRRFDAEAAQFLPILPRHVVAVRLATNYTNNETGQHVPFYMLPYVGGGDTVRSFHEFRFHDENFLFLNAEYRWMPLPVFHVAFFVDAGEVRADWQQIDFKNLKPAYGVGFRAGTEKRVLVRLDIGTGGGEGTVVFLKFGPSF